MSDPRTLSPVPSGIFPPATTDGSSDRHPRGTQGRGPFAETRGFPGVRWVFGGEMFPLCGPLLPVPPGTESPPPSPPPVEVSSPLSPGGVFLPLLSVGVSSFRRRLRSQVALGPTKGLEV